MQSAGKKTLGQAIDEIIAAVEALDEPARVTAVRAACEHLGLSALAPSAAGQTDAPAAQPPTELIAHTTAAPAAIHDIRSFKAQKAPASAIEMACVVAYFMDSLAEPGERKVEVSTPDMEKYFKQGGYPLQKRMPQLLVSAKAAGYFDAAGHGKYKLNPVGHNLVAHKLPRKAVK